MTRLLVLAVTLMLVAGGCTRNAGQVAEETPLPTLSPTPSASPSPTEPPMPVMLEGPVNNAAISDLIGMGAAPTQEITMADLAFTPTFIKVASEATLKVTLRNPGGLADHTFTLDSLGVDRQLKPGEQADFELKLPAAGEALRFYCRLHADKGMQGAIYFNDGEPVSTASIAPAPAPAPAQGTRRATTSRRVNPPPAPAPAPRRTGDLDIPDLDINDEDEAGNLRGSSGTDGVRGERGTRGEPGGDPVDADIDVEVEPEEEEEGD